jgi:hypothetical protein
MTLGISDTKHKITHHHYAECRYAKRIFVILNVVMLNAVKLNVVMLSVVNTDSHWALIKPFWSKFTNHFVSYTVLLL